MEITILDIETTGFLKQGGKIVEIGIVSLCLETGVVKELFNQVMHERPITKEEVSSSWIVNNSSLTIEDIQKSRQLKEYVEEIQNILEGSENGVTAWNSDFDFGFLEDRGFKFLKKLPCPMKQTTNFFKLPKIGGYGGYKWAKVEEAYKILFEDQAYKEAHRGGEDAKDEAKIIFELYKRGAYKPF